MTVDGSTVVTMSKDSTSRVWDAKDGTCMHVLRGHTDSVIGGCLSDEGRILATHSFDNTARLWSLDGGACLATIDLKTSIGRMALSSAGSYLATAMTDGTVLLRDLAHPREEIVVRGHSDEVTDLSFASDERLLTTCSLDCTARLVDVATGALRGVFVSDCGLTCCHYDSVTHLIVAGTDRGVVHFVDASLPLNVL